MKTQNTLLQVTTITAVTLLSMPSVFALQTMGNGMVQGENGTQGQASGWGMQGFDMSDSDVSEGQNQGAGMRNTPKTTGLTNTTPGSRTTSAVNSPAVNSNRFATDENFEKVDTIDDGNVDTEGNLWTENDASLGNATHKGDLVVIGDLDIGNADIEGDVYVRGKFTLGNGTVMGNVVVEGDMETGNAEVSGYIFVTGNLDAGNSDFSGPVYAYGKKSEVSNGTSGKKLKIAGALSSGNMTRTGPVYVFGKKSIQNASGKAVTPKGLFGKVDPFLLIDLNAEDLAEVKAITSKYEAEVSATKKSLAGEYRTYKAAIKTKVAPTNVATIEELKSKLT